jgi:ABC-2 type transport system ATP-binding protein
MSAAIQASGLGKAYRRAWALRDCTLAIPEGHVVGLVGPNGAARPPCCAWPPGCSRRPEARSRSLAGAPQPGRRSSPGVGFVAQDTAVCARMTTGQDGDLRIHPDLWSRDSR